MYSEAPGASGLDISHCLSSWTKRTRFGKTSLVVQVDDQFSGTRPVLASPLRNTPEVRNGSEVVFRVP